MDTQSGLVYHRVGPDAVDQLILKDRFTCALNQDDKDLERPTPQPYRLFLLEQQPFPGTSRNGPKAKTVLSTGHAALADDLIEASLGNSPRKVNLFDREAKSSPLKI